MRIAVPIISVLLSGWAVFAQADKLCGVVSKSQNQNGNTAYSVPGTSVWDGRTWIIPLNSAVSLALDQTNGKGGNICFEGSELIAGGAQVPGSAVHAWYVYALSK
jgi:hypothetical protein